MTTDTANVLVGEGWRDGLEAGVRGRIRGFIEELLEEELTAALGRARYARTRASERLASVVRGSASDESDAADELAIVGHRNGHRDRQVMGTFGATTVSVPRARLEAADGETSEWHSKALPAYQRRTKEIDAVIAGAYLAGVNTRRVGRALAALFRGSVSKDTVSRTWRKIKGDWDTWNKRDLSREEIVRLILDGTVVRVRIDRQATAISLLVVLGVRRLVKRGLQQPELAIVDGAAGLEKALASLWSDLLVQRCTVHKLRNLIAHAPKRLAEEVASDFSDVINAKSAKEVATRRQAFIRKWRLKCRAVADSLEEAGEQLFTFTRLPPLQWKSARTTNAIERLHEEFKRRIKTQTVLPSAETAAMLFWALLASGQIRLRKVDGWRTLGRELAQPIDLAA